MSGKHFSFYCRSDRPLSSWNACVSLDTIGIQWKVEHRSDDHRMRDNYVNMIHSVTSLSLIKMYKIHSRNDATHTLHSFPYFSFVCKIKHGQSWTLLVWVTWENKSNLLTHSPYVCMGFLLNMSDTGLENPERQMKQTCSYKREKKTYLFSTQ